MSLINNKLELSKGIERESRAFPASPMENLMSSTRAVVISTLAIFMLMLVPPEPSGAAPSPSNSHPLCVSQYALVSQSCAQYFLRRDNEDGEKHIRGHEHDDDHEHEEDREHEEHHQEGHEHEHHEDHEQEHHEEKGNGERNEGGRQRRGRRRGENETREGEPDEEDCCRWLEEMDDECVCDLLIRLPPFLTKAPHNYSVSIGEECSVTYTCGEMD